LENAPQGLQGEPYASSNTQGAALGLELTGLPGRFYPDNNNSKLFILCNFVFNFDQFPAAGGSVRDSLNRNFFVFIR